MATEKPLVRAEELKDLIIKNDGTARDLNLSRQSLSGEMLSDMILSGINLTEADLNGTLLRNACLDYAALVGANLAPLPWTGGKPFITTLEGASLEGADLRRAICVEADLRGAKLKGAKMQGCILNGADLKDADLTNADLQDAILSGANLEGANLTLAVLYGADLTGTNLHRALFSNTKIDQDGLGNEIVQEKKGAYLDAKFIYLALKDNFQDIGAYEAASWAYVKERTMERTTYKPRFARLYYYNREVPKDQRNALWKWLWTGSFYTKYIWYYVKSSLYWFFFGYGERPFHAIYFCAFWILFFSVLYSLTGGFANETGRAYGFSDYFLHSLGAFTTNPYLIPLTWWSKVFTSLEAMTGVTALAAFTTAMIRRIGGR